jgi:hypothetical protein
VRVVLEHLPSLNSYGFKWLDEARLAKSIHETFNVPDSNGRTCSIYPTDDPRSIRRGHIDLPRHASNSIATQLAEGVTLKLIFGPKENPKVISPFPKRRCCSHVRVHQYPRIFIKPAINFRSKIAAQRKTFTRFLKHLLNATLTLFCTRMHQVKCLLSPTLTTTVPRTSQREWNVKVNVPSGSQASDGVSVPSTSSPQPAAKTPTQTHKAGVNSDLDNKLAQIVRLSPGHKVYWEDVKSKFRELYGAKLDINHVTPTSTPSVTVSVGHFPSCPCDLVHF